MTEIRLCVCLSMLSLLTGCSSRVPPSQLAPPSPAPQVAAVVEPYLPPGTVAVSLRTNQESSSWHRGNQPNDRVDLIQRTPKEKGERYAELLAENVLVIAIDSQMQRVAEGESPFVTTTLALTPQDAAKVQLARQNGASFIIMPFRRHAEGPQVTFEDLKVEDLQDK